MDVVEYPHKQLGEEVYNYVIINAPMTCLTLKKIVTSLMVESINKHSIDIQGLISLFKPHHQTIVYLRSDMLFGVLIMIYRRPLL